MDNFRPDTQWICLDNKEGNVYFEARALFEAKSGDAPLLKITADSRYIVYLNGIKLGFGPVRYYRGAISFDEYDLKPYLNIGSNEIRVLVHHFGVETFQYQLGRPGLLAEIASGTQVISQTGKDWQVREATEFSIYTPRASCQLDWVIHFDATIKGEDFKEPNVFGAVGIKPWGTPVKRDIPFLTEEKLYPQVILSESLVGSPYLIKTINLQPYFRPHDYSANPAFLQGLLLTIIYAEEITEVVFPKTLERTGALLLNGQAITLGQRVSLKRGNNLLIIDITGHYHDLFTTVCIEKVTKKLLMLKNPLEEGTNNASPFLAVREGELVKTFVFQSSNDIKEALKNSQYEQVKLEHIASENVWLLSCLNQPRPGKVSIVKANNLCLGIGNPTIINPAICDSEIILDFGKTVVGFIGFTIDAPEGVCLDFNLFEAYENEKPIYTEGLRNALRYKTKKGLQKFISPKRQGFRYLKLTICNLEKSLTIYEMFLYTTRLCMEDTYVDCPTEQTYWVGDARNEVEDYLRERLGGISLGTIKHALQISH